MAQRLATEYAKTYLQLTDFEMSKFMQLFSEFQVALQFKVFENGNQEIVLQDKETDEEIVLTFERKGDKYVLAYSCVLSNQILADVMRKAISAFRGDAVVNRIYSGFTMVYHYAKGSVVKIEEVSDRSHKIIYEYKDTLGKLEQVFLKQNAEAEIRSIQNEIDALLDQRNQTQDNKLHLNIDQELQLLNYKLFILEA